MKRFSSALLPVLIPVLLLSGCASYHAASLNSLLYEPIVTVSQQKSDGISIIAKAFDKADCKKYLDRDVLAKGYQPVQIYIRNDSDKSYSFSLNRISLSCARPEEVAARVHTSTVGRAVGYGAASLILWPMAIPAVVDGFGSANANEALDNDFISKTARDTMIDPHSHLNKILFVPITEYKESFTVTLLEVDSNTPKKLIVKGNE